MNLDHKVPAKLSYVMVYYTVSVLVIGYNPLIYLKIAHFYVRVRLQMGVENRENGAFF